MTTRARSDGGTGGRTRSDALLRDRRLRNAERRPGHGQGPGRDDPGPAAHRQPRSLSPGAAAVTVGDPLEPGAAQDPMSATAEFEVLPGRARRHGLRGWLRRLRPSAIGAFALAFAFMLAAVAAVGFAQFTASRLAPWVSIGSSAVAVGGTIAALVLDRQR